MNSEHIHTRPITDPRIVARALAAADVQGIRPAAREVGVSPKSIRAWRVYQAEQATLGRAWPTERDIAAWVAAQPELARRRVIVQRGRRRRILRLPQRTHVPAVGTQRRLQALTALGWPSADLAAQLGWSKSRVGHLSVARFPTVTTETATAVAELYDRLSMTPGPSRSATLRARGKNWAPPLAWDDDAIDNPDSAPTTATDGEDQDDVLDDLAIAAVLEGHRMLLSPPELDVAIPRLLAAGHERPDIAMRVGLTTEAVARIADRLATRSYRARQATQPATAA